MRFVVRHETLYRYSTPVVLGAHVVRLSPRAGHDLRSRTLVIRPQPVFVGDEVDGFGNRVSRVTFAGVPTSELSVESRFELDTRSPAYAADHASPSLPWTAWLPPAELAPYAPPWRAVDPAAAAFARDVLGQSGARPLAFLEALCATIHGRADHQIRATGDAQAPAQTLASWRGACRDFTTLFLEAARSLGMPARFCSGYQAIAGTGEGRRDLHAWPEVFVDGVGWRGWDPTQGMAVGAGHVAVCAAPDQADTMPITGTYAFTGEVLTSTLDFSVEIRTT